VTHAATLSVCMLAATSPAQMAVQLGAFRVVADELVVAIDDRVDLTRLGPVLDLADVVVTMTYRPPFEAHLAWLHSLCQGDWILRIDGDEIPSTQLLRTLPGLVTQPDSTHARIRRRWLYPDADSYLTRPPWTPDYQTRLVRNDPALVHVPGIMHTSVEVVGPGRYVDAPLYHADLLMATQDARRRKLRAYDQLRPGLRAQGDLSQNVAFYLPESRDVDTAPVLDEDQDLIARFLRAHEPSSLQARAKAGPPSAGSSPVPQPDGREDGHRASLALIDPVGTLRQGEVRHVALKATNEGTTHWPWLPAAEPDIYLSYRILTAGGEPVLEGLRARMPVDIRPGQSETVTVPVAVDVPPGDYLIAFDLVHERVRWFGVDLTVPVQVTTPRRVALIAGVSPTPHLGDDAVVHAHLTELAEAAPDVELVMLAPWTAELSERFGYRCVSDWSSRLLDGLGPDYDDEDRRELFRRVVEIELDADRMARGLPLRTVHEPEITAMTTIATSSLFVAASAGALTSLFPGELYRQAAAILTAHRLGVRIVLSGITFGPFATSDLPVARRIAQAADLIRVRDRSTSASLLTSLGVSQEHIIEDFDDAGWLTGAAEDIPEVSQVLQRIPLERTIVVSLHPPRSGHLSLAGIAAALQSVCRRRGMALALLPHWHDADGPDATTHAALLSRLAPSIEVHRIDTPLHPRSALAIVGRAAVTVGTRYHLAVFAAMTGTPAIGLWTDLYTHVKLAGLRDFAPGVTLAASDASADTLERMFEEHLNRGRGPAMAPCQPLPYAELGALGGN
jgi:polysaccharide pyruvyl transferase WcaK-like protein